MLAAVAGQAWAEDAVDAAVASGDRPAADTARDARRMPAALVRFAGVKAGDRVADIVPATGYFTRIFANVVGPSGRVFAIVPKELLAVLPTAADDVKRLAGESKFRNVSVLVAPTAQISAPEPLDVAWTSDNYHDIYGFFGPAQAAALDAAVFRMLKPGGVFIVIDHVAKPGTSATSPRTLHRIDPETVKTQILAAGFRFVGESGVLANASDKHNLVVFAPSIKGRTDQFAMKFAKPGG
jgi:predicted methyltransferase